MHYLQLHKQSEKRKARHTSTLFGSSNAIKADISGPSDFRKTSVHWLRSLAIGKGMPIDSSNCILARLQASWLSLNPSSRDLLRDWIISILLWACIQKNLNGRATGVFIFLSRTKTRSYAHIKASLLYNTFIFLPLAWELMNKPCYSTGFRS